MLITDFLSKCEPPKPKPLLKMKKPEKIEMSLVMLEVKPLDDTTNLDDLAKRILGDIK